MLTDSLFDSLYQHFSDIRMVFSNSLLHFTWTMFPYFFLSFLKTVEYNPLFGQTSSFFESNSQLITFADGMRSLFQIVSACLITTAALTTSPLGITTLKPVRHRDDEQIFFSFNTDGSGVLQEWHDARLIRSIIINSSNGTETYFDSIERELYRVLKPGT